MILRTYGIISYRITQFLIALTCAIGAATSVCAQENAPTIMPPDLPARPPIPTPAPIIVPPLTNPFSPKTPLSWRVTGKKPTAAMPYATNNISVSNKIITINSQPLAILQNQSQLEPQLQSQVQSAITTQKPKTSSIELNTKYHASFDQTLIAVMSACLSSGFTIEKINSQTGVIIARTNDDLTAPSIVHIHLEETAPAYVSMEVSLESSDYKLSKQSNKSAVLRQLLACTTKALADKGAH